MSFNVYIFQATTMDILKIDQVSKTFNTSFLKKKDVIRNVSLVLPQNKVMGFLGPNGAGKSTIIKMVLDFIRPDSGKIEIGGVPNNDPISRRGVGFLPEHPYLYDNLTANELLLFFGKMGGVPKEKIKDRGVELLTKLNLIQVADKKLRTYSKGMQQRVGFALAIINDPRLLILDEPLSGLDPMGRHMIIELILELKNQGKSIFFSSHVLNDIERVCDLVTIIDHGTLLYCGGIRECIGNNNGLEDSFVQIIKEHN